MPHLDFVGSGHFKFPENDCNISPLAKAAQGFASSVVTVSLTSIGAVCSLDRESVASVLKAIFSAFIQAGRAGKFCKLDMRLGCLVAYPNGTLQFENCAGQGNLDDQIEVNLKESRFKTRQLAQGGPRSLLASRNNPDDCHSQSLNRMGQAQTFDNNAKRTHSLYSSVRVNQGGFARMSNTTSIMTPYSNIGGEVSRYGGKNRMLRQWYEAKGFQSTGRQLGFALNKKQLGTDVNEIYSQFSGRGAEELLASHSVDTRSNKSQADKEVLEALRKNEFLPKVTFDDFLAKKLGKGKRTLFLNRPTEENAR